MELRIFVVVDDPSGFAAVAVDAVRVVEGLRHIRTGCFSTALVSHSILLRRRNYSSWSFH